MGFFQKVNKIWSGLDFWDQRENQEQRQSFAVQDEEEERRRRAEQAARNSVSQQNAPTPGDVITPQQNAAPNLTQLGDLSAGGSLEVDYDPNQPLQKFQQPEPAPSFGDRIRGGLKGLSEAPGEFYRGVTGGLKGTVQAGRDITVGLVKAGHAVATNKIGKRQDEIAVALEEVDRAGDQVIQAVRRGEISSQEARGLIDEINRDYRDPLNAALKDISGDPDQRSNIAKFFSGAKNLVVEAGKDIQQPFTSPEAQEKRFEEYTGRKPLNQEELYGYGIGLSALGIADLFTGGGKTKLARELAQATTAEAVSKALGKRGLTATDDIIEKLRVLKDKKEISGIVDELAVDAVGKETAGRAAEKQTRALDVAESPIDRPAFQHQQDIQDVIDEGEAKLNDFVNETPNVSVRDLEIARAAIKNEVLAKIEALQTARYVEIPDLNIPDVSSPVALAKAADGLENVAPIADFSKADQVPLQKAEGAPVPAKTVGAPVVDAAGNPALVPDAARARELAEQGVVPERGASPVAAAEDEMAAAAERTAAEQVSGDSRVTAFKDPVTGENLLLPSEGVVDEIISLQAIPAARRTAAQESKLRELLDIYRNWDERSVPGTAPGVAERFPDMTPGGQQAVQETLDQLQLAKASSRDLRKARSEEKGARIARAGEAYERAGGGVEGMRAKTRALAGKYSKSAYEPVQVSEASQREVLDDINAATNLRDWEKFNTQRAFEKMWGTVDEAPTQSDIRNIQRYYNGKSAGLGDAVAEQLRDLSKGAEDFNLLEQIAGAPRTAMTTADFSAARQGAAMMARHPIEGTKAFLNGIVNAFRPKRFNKAVEEMATMADANGVNYADFMQSVMDVHLPSIIEKSSEELMSSTPLLKKIPVYGKVVAGSDRAFTGTLSELRFNVAKNWIDNVGGIDAVMQNFSEKELRDLGEVLNTVSGRGGKAGGFVDKHASILSKTLFSGRLWASRLNMLNPYWYYRLSGPARREALSSAAAFSALAGTTLYMISQNFPDVEVGNDPRSADFGKIKVGNTRYDILAGFQQNIRVASQVLTGTKINSATGEEKDVTPADAIGPFAEGKLSPLLGFAWRLAKSGPSDDQNPLTREDEYGNELNVGTEGAKLFAPMTLTGSLETAQDVGSLAKGVAMNIPNAFGVGVQTYGGQAKVPTKTKDIEQAVKDKDYDRAISGYQALIDKENKKKNPSSGAIEELQGKIEKINRERDDVPDTLEATNARIERGDFSAAIAGYRQLLVDEQKLGKDASPEKAQKMEDNIKRLEITVDGGYDASVFKMYEDISLSEWRDMTDPDDESYDPETAGLLLDYDKQMAEAGVSRGKAGDRPKYSLKKSGGRGRRGSKANIITNIGTITPGADFVPLKAQSATNALPQSAIPRLEKVPNYSRKLKKISVSRGRK